MNNLFRRLPLSFKLILVGLIPLAFIIYLTLQLYNEKNKNVAVIKSNIGRINQVSNITELIRQLQQEQKLSFDYIKNGRGEILLRKQRNATNNVLEKLRSDSDEMLKGFESYTSLQNLQTIRNDIDSTYKDPSQVTHFFSNTIFRLNTLANVPYGGETVLEPFYHDLVSKKLLSEIITYFGIIRNNIYNVLTTRKFMTETLVGTMGAYDVLKSYEKEFLLKANQQTLSNYTRIQNNTDLKPALDYIHQLFSTFSFDSSYTAETWWTVSENGIMELSALSRNLGNQVAENINIVYRHEVEKKNRSLILLLVITLLVLAVIVYMIYILTSMLNELKEGAEKIAKGSPGVQFDIHSRDAIGSLAASIAKIDLSQQQLTYAAEEIGKGKFSTVVHARSNEDILAKALDLMKNNLRKSMQELQESEEQFKQLADLMPQIVWTADAEGKVDYYNRQWFSYVGPEVRDDDNVIHPDDINLTLKNWKKAVEEGKGFAIEIRILNYLSKEYRWFLVRAIPVFDANGTIRKWFGTSTDIHDRKTMSENLEKLVQQRTEELERSNEDLMQFAHVVSHDMKEPLRKINIFSGRLDEELKGKLTENAKTYLSKIGNAAIRMIAMIDGILQFSTIQAGNQPFETVDLNEALVGICTDLELSIQQKNATINYEYLPKITGIPVLIHQLFYNLLVNALKFSKPGIDPLISINFSKVTQPNTVHYSRHFPAGNYIEITIEDNGIGIDRAMDKKIFDVFTRLHARDKYEGTGLGLALCKKIMERHQGGIYVESEPGKGSVFHLLFHNDLKQNASTEVHSQLKTEPKEP